MAKAGNELVNPVTGLRTVFRKTTQDTSGEFYSSPSIEVLQEEYARKGRIDGKAAVKAFHEVRIEAPVERVWELLQNVPGWRTWYSDVHDVHLDSPSSPTCSFPGCAVAGRL